MNAKYLSTSLIAFTLIASGCGKTTSSTEDTSTSGSVASAAAGAYNGSSSTGTEAMNEQKRKVSDIEKLLASLNPLSSANASTACSTVNSTTLASCVSGGTASVTYSDCSFGASTATWTGGVSFTCSGTLQNPTVTRSINNGTTRTNSYGSVVTINSTESGGLYTFNSASVAGGGTTYTSSSLNILGVNLVGKDSSGLTTFNHTIATSTPLTISSGAVTGTVTTYHNLAKVIATSKLALTFTSGCCTPTGGTIVTTFVADGRFAAKSGFNGATETLTFTGCGAATYTGPEGYTGAVTLANCF
jgi:hypothetical protein